MPVSAFHEIRFPLEIALASRGGPHRLTDIVTSGSGREERNQRWYHSRRRFNAGYGVKTLAELATIVEFFEERRGRLYGFRWRDRADWKSCLPQLAPTAFDQVIGQGDGATQTFQLIKTYGAAHAPYLRPIRKPVAGSLHVAIEGVELSQSDFTLDETSGLVTLAAAPANGYSVSAGFSFDTPVRFDTDHLEIDFVAFEAGEIPEIPIIEILTGA